MIHLLLISRNYTSLISKYSKGSNTVVFSTCPRAQSAYRPLVYATACPVDENTEDQVKVGQVLLEVAHLRPGVAAPLFPPLVSEENPLFASGCCTPHHLFIPVDRMANGQQRSAQSAQ